MSDNYEEVEKDVWEQTYLVDGGLLYINDTLDQGQAELDDLYAERYQVEFRSPVRPHPEVLHEDIETLDEARELLDGELE